VAEDEAVVRSVLGTILVALGYEVVEAVNGEEAVARFSEAPNSFRFAVLDVRMPVLDGRGALRRIRRLRPGFPVILSSGADALPGDEPEGGVTFLPKPYSLEQLERCIEIVLEPRGDQRDP
jgi:CheY-like chemotaxis protein